MKKQMVVILAMVLLLTTLTTVAFAASGRLATPVKTSSGGALGKTTGAGYMEWFNYAGLGQDMTSASTDSDAKGTVKVTAKVTYADGEGTKTKSSSATTYNSTYAAKSCTAPSDAHGTNSSSSHSYSSENYGSWSASLSYTY